jgi:hypothetical protein
MPAWILTLLGALISPLISMVNTWIGKRQEIEDRTRADTAEALLKDTVKMHEHLRQVDNLNVTTPTREDWNNGRP